MDRVMERCGGIWGFRETWGGLTGPRADTEWGGETYGAIIRVRVTSRGIRGHGQGQAVVERRTRPWAESGRL